MSMLFSTIILVMSVAVFRRRHSNILVSTFAFYFMALCLSGCKNFVASTPISEISIPKKFDEVAIKKNNQTVESLEEWWTNWHDAQLNKFVSKSLFNSTDVIAARARVIEARSGVDYAEGGLLPTVGVYSAVAGGPVDWISRGPFQSVGPVATSNLIPTSNLPISNFVPNSNSVPAANLEGITGTWEPDLFGGRRDDAMAALYTELTVEEQLRGVQLQVSIETADNYFSVIYLSKRKIILDQSIATSEKLLEYTQARFNAGQAQTSDINLIRQQLLGLTNKKEPLLAEIQVHRRKLAVLSGTTPETQISLVFNSTARPPRLPEGILPSDVLNRRPDVRARLAALNSQLFRLNSAKKDLLPRFQISFFGGNGRLQFLGLPGIQGLGGLAALTVQLPIFSGGKIEANILANDARLQVALAEYNKAILQSLEEVENAYGIRLALDRRETVLLSSLSYSKLNLHSTNELFQSGSKTIGDTLIAKLDVLAREDEVTQAQLDAAKATIRLYASLGGGW